MTFYAVSSFLTKIEWNEVIYATLKRRIRAREHISMQQN